MGVPFTNLKGFPHYSVLCSGCQLEEGDGNLLSTANELVQHLKLMKKMLHPETFCKVSLLNPYYVVSSRLMGFVTWWQKLGALSDEQLLCSAPIAIICEIKITECCLIWIFFFSIINKDVRKCGTQKILHYVWWFLFDTPKLMHFFVLFCFLRMMHTILSVKSHLDWKQAKDSRFYFVLLHFVNNRTAQQLDGDMAIIGISTSLSWNRKNAYPFLQAWKKHSPSLFCPCQGIRVLCRRTRVCV